MNTTRYYSFIAFIVLAVPYMWGVPSYFPFLLTLSAGCFLVLKKVIPKIDPKTAPMDTRRILYFLGAAGVMLGHAALIRHFIIHA